MCGLCERTLTEYVCTVEVRDPHRDPKALLYLRVCKRCAERAVEILEREGAPA